MPYIHGPVLPLVIEPVERTGRYTHMAKGDAPVWERFVERFGALYIGVAYDVALGGVGAPEGALRPDDARGWQYSTALKIDALLFGAGEILIVEVRPHATVSALGAVIAYRLIAEREQLGDQPLRGAIVCASIQVDVQWCAERLGVGVFVV